MRCDGVEPAKATVLPKTTSSLLQRSRSGQQEPGVDGPQTTGSQGPPTVLLYVTVQIVSDAYEENSELTMLDL